MAGEASEDRIQPAAPGAFKVEVSGDTVGGGYAASNVTSTMFAERHTKSILSDETIEQHLLAA